jgi:hypothetical protein
VFLIYASEPVDQTFDWSQHWIEERLLTIEDVRHEDAQRFRYSEDNREEEEYL